MSIAVRLSYLLIFVLFVGCGSQPKLTQLPEESTGSFKEFSGLDAYTEEALGDDENGVVAVAGRDCPIDDQEVEEIDNMLLLTPDEREAVIDKHAIFGIPISEMAGLNETKIINRHYVVNYDNELKIPTFASYKLLNTDIVSRTRVDCFREDIRLEGPDRSRLIDYVEPVFDRGHLVPRADMNRQRSAMLNTFVLSNMMPQHDRFNRDIWQLFEALIRSWADNKGEITILTGAVFDKDANGQRDDYSIIDRVRPRNNIAIPTHFYKIVLFERPNEFIETISILLDHDDVSGRSKQEKLNILQDRITSIDSIESLTGLNIFPKMPEEKQRAVERSIASGLWPF